MTTRIKICGITRQQDADAAVDAGADALGLNFAAESPRRVSVQDAARKTPEECARYGMPFMKVFRVRGALDMAALEAAYQGACCFLLDAYVPGVSGGTGKHFDWRFWPQTANKKLVLAGGLTPENVAQAITQTRPWAVDVSGGVEGATKGEKDAQLIGRFISEVRRAGS